MTPAQLLLLVKKGTPPPAILLLGPEAYQRRRIKEAMLAAFPEGAVTQHDLTEIGLSETIDDARALSLFAAERLIWVVTAEAVLPRGKAAAADDESSDSEGPASASTGDSAPLAAYLSDPTPGVTLVFEAIRFDFEGDDKRKQDRVLKFFAPIKAVVELQRYSPADARTEAEALVRQAGFRIDPDALDMLVESLGADIARIAVEIEKLALFAGNRSVSTEDISALVPDARAATIFALVNALGRRDRPRSLAVMDTLTREGEYLPLALSFLSTQFRMALTVREAGLKSASQVQGHFAKLGVQVWGSRADQIWQTVSKFTRPQLERGLELIYRADKGLRDARPDDRTIIEQFILELVG
jgi:DNA polymerase-3 subunit delta